MNKNIPFGMQHFCRSVDRLALRRLRDKEKCPKCARLHKTGSTAWGTQFFFVCGNGHVQANESVRDRLAMVQHFNQSRLRAAMNVDGLQKAVRTAIERRLKKLGGTA